MGCITMLGQISMKPKTFEAAFPSFSLYSFSSKYTTHSNVKNGCGAAQHSQVREALFKTLSNASTSVLSGFHGSFPRTSPSFILGHPHQRNWTALRASKDVPSSYRYPTMMKKPKWWWRTLACIPYLMPIHETWMYAETAYHLHPFLEDFEFLTYPFLRFIGSLPRWFLVAYFFVAYLGVVRRKEWPHFFRFHVVMGMLLEIALQAVGTITRWMPLALYWGKVGMHFWTAFAFAYLFTILECIRCALVGIYADVPFACDAAYMQIPYD